MTYDNATWLDDDNLWRAWTFNKEQNRYYFDDLGEESFTDAWEYLWAASEGGEEEESLFEGRLVEL